MAAPGNNCQYAVRLLVSYLRTKQFMTQPLHAAISLCHYNSFGSDYTCTININYIINCNLIYIYTLNSVHPLTLIRYLNSSCWSGTHLRASGFMEAPSLSTMPWNLQVVAYCPALPPLFGGFNSSTYCDSSKAGRLQSKSIKKTSLPADLPFISSMLPFLLCFHFFWERFKLTPVNAEKLGHVYKVDQCKSQWMIYNYINYTITGQSCHNISYRISKSQIPKTHHDAAKEPLRRVNWPLRSSFGFLEAIWHNPQRFKALFRD